MSRAGAERMGFLKDMLQQAREVCLQPLACCSFFTKDIVFFSQIVDFRMERRYTGKSIWNEVRAWILGKGRQRSGERVAGQERQRPG